MLNPRGSTRRQDVAQALIELAVFGAVLFYLIGVSVSTYINSAYQQQSRLQIMRMALLSSYQSSKARSANRSSGTFLMFDDRLTGDGARFGSTDRQPVIASGSGYMSTQVMQPVDFKDVNNLTVMDLNVNEQSFILRTSGFANYYVFIPNGGPYLSINHVPAGSEARVHIGTMDDEKLNCAQAMALPRSTTREEALRRLAYERAAFAGSGGRGLRFRRGAVVRLSAHGDQRLSVPCP